MNTLAPALTTRMATVDDLHAVCTAFLHMLTDLAPLGHDILPTRHNATWFGSYVFDPALETGEHGIILAYAGEELVGCTFFAPERTELQLRGKRAIAHGIWVAPEWRRQGVALLLQDEAHAQLRDLGFTELISNVVRDNEAGMASARKAGAAIIGYLTSVQLTGGA